MFRKALLAAALTVTGLIAFPAISNAAVVYNNIPAPLPGGLPSEAFQATQTSEFGGEVGLAGTDRQDPKITITMVNWGCQSIVAGVCTSTPGSTFTHPITLNVYSVMPSGEPGGLISSVTETKSILFRPTSDPTCPAPGHPNGAWRPTGSATCFNGVSSNITYDLTGRGVSLPDKVILTLAYNTSNYGEDPIGTQPCSATAQGCPYDSLNVGLNTLGSPTAGFLPRPDDAYLDSSTGGQYCDGGTGGTGFLRLDEGCWTGFEPAISIDATPGPTGPAGPTGATGAAGAAGAVQGVTAKSCKKGKKLNKKTGKCVKRKKKK
jgi:hypothetical protein